MNQIRNRVVFSHILRRIRHNRNAMILAAGDTGSGKSYACLRFSTKLDKNFNADMVQFKAKDFLKMVNKDYPPGTAMVFDEVGVAMNARSWQSKLNKMLSYVLQTFRFKNYIVFFTVPDLSFVDVHARKMFHYIMESKGIDHKAKVSKWSFKRVQVNRRTGDIYYKAIRYITDDGMAVAPMIKLKLAHGGLINAYEKKRAQYIKELYTEMEQEEETKKPEIKKREPKTCDNCGYIWTPKVDRPKKCPSCQHFFTYTTTT